MLTVHHRPWEVALSWISVSRLKGTQRGVPTSGHHELEGGRTFTSSFELGGVQVDRNKYPTLQRNSAQMKGNDRILPKPIVVKIEVNGHPV